MNTTIYMTLAYRKIPIIIPGLTFVQNFLLALTECSSSRTQALKQGIEQGRSKFLGIRPVYRGLINWVYGYIYADIWVLSIPFVLFSANFGCKRILSSFQFRVYWGTFYVFSGILGTFFRVYGYTTTSPPPPPGRPY